MYFLFKEIYKRNKPLKIAGYAEKYMQAQKKADEVREYIYKHLGIKPNISVSVTDFGTSLYIYGETKIRISDHSVTNYDRMFNEVHHSLSNYQNPWFIVDVEQSLFPERYKTVQVEERKINTSKHIWPSVEELETKYQDNPEFKILKVEPFITKKGLHKYNITWQYGVPRTRYKTVRIKP